MHHYRRKAAGVAVLAASLSLPTYLAAEGPRDLEGEGGIRHVLLISIDGMHALDYENCVANHTCPNLASLGRTGVNYTRTSTSRPSDSFPGLMALVTGGSPKTVGPSTTSPGIAFWHRHKIRPVTDWLAGLALQEPTTEPRPSTKKAMKSTSCC